MVYYKRRKATTSSPTGGEMKEKYTGIWRVPGVCSYSYPQLMVDDNVVTGSINVRNSRLPLWAIIHTAILEGWERVENGWAPEKHYDYTKEDLAHFLYCLLEQRGEFGRLLLMLATAEDKNDEGWWEKKTHRRKIIAQLKRCLNVLAQLEEK